MSINRRDIVAVDLDAGMYKDNALRILAYGDDNPEIIGVLPKRSGATVTDSVSVKGYFVRADGVTVELSGTQDAETHECSVTITDDCLAVEGAFVLAVQLRASEVWRTVRMMEGTVAATRTGQLLENDAVIADLEALRAAVALAIVAPSGGNVGDALIKTATGYAWGSAGGAPNKLTIGGIEYTIREGGTPDATHITITYED